MSKITLKFASWKKKNDIFQAIKDGVKTIETRPATEKHLSIKIGDTLDLVSSDTQERIEKTVTFVCQDKSVGEMAINEDINKIVPGVKTPEDLVTVFDEFKKKWGRGYAEKLEKYGIVSIGLK